MSFADPAYVDTWRQTGRYPKIHSDLVAMVAQRAPAGPILDLCSSTGLLGRRLVDEGFEVYAVDGDRRAVAVGQAAGVYGPGGVTLLRAARLDVDGLAPLTHQLRDRRVVTVVARRCLPELSEVMEVRHLAAALIDGGVTDLFIEGRVDSPRSTHPLRNVDREMSALAGWFQPVTRRAACCHLRSVRPARSGPGADPAGSASSEG